jgi:nitrite reductase (NADH) large subunit
MTKTRQKLVVIGNGMAGARLVEDVLARGGAERFEIAMFGDEPYGNYNRILLSAVLAGTSSPRDIFINPLSWYLQNRIRLHAGVRVQTIDRATRTVRSADGVTERYDALVLATGSQPFVPRIEGLHAGAALKEGAFVFRSLDDCNSITAHARQSKKAAVIGGGLLGLEAARGLIELGLEVHVVHLKGHLMETQLDPRGGQLLQRTLERMGVKVHLGKNTRAVLGEERVTALSFESGEQLDCDMVVISAGIRPHTALAKQAELEVKRGIVVGDDLTTSDRDIYAVGECAEHRGQTYGLVAPLWEQTRVLADRLTGARPAAVYEGSKVSTKLKVMGVELTVMGQRDAEGDGDEEISFADAGRGVYKKLLIRDGKLVGAMLLGDTSASPRLLQSFDRGLEVPDDPAELLFPPAGAPAQASVLEMPLDAQVCNCNGVSKGTVMSAVGAGCRTLKTLSEATRAGTGCGSCKKDLSCLLDNALGGEAPAEDPSAHYYVPGVALTKPELTREIKARRLRSVSAVFAALAGGKEDLASKTGLASLLKTLWGGEYEDQRDARFINDRVHANIQNDGTFSVVPRIYGGVTTPQELRRIADVAERYDAKMVKITGGQRIDLLGIRREHLPEVWRALGMPSGHAYTKAFRTCKTCVGSEFCRYGVGDSTALGIAIEKRFQGLEAPHKMKLATAGCPRNCSEALVKDLGAVAIEGGRWEIYVGGAAGSRVRKGDLLCTVESHDEVLKMMGRFMQYYREHARYLERTYDFVERLGIAKVRAVVVDDAEGICAELDEAIDAAVAAYHDPWDEAERPVHPTQFLGALEGVSP